MKSWASLELKRFVLGLVLIWPSADVYSCEENLDPRLRLSHHVVPAPIEGFTDAVVVVLRQGERILYAQRGHETTGSGEWSFVGGKAEPGESILQTARREVFEEVGVLLKDPRLLFVTASVDGASRYRIFVMVSEYEGRPTIQAQERGKIAALWNLHLREEPYPLFRSTLAYFSEIQRYLLRTLSSQP